MFLCTSLTISMSKTSCDIGHSWPSETTSRRAVLELSADELQWIRNAVHDKQVFLDVGESTLARSI